ncbi:F0F1 ATP synthase subunit B [Nesterenkonia aerolata]|uniref:ATP synthase subunit b n=1 Tax=Nesterenkonia aerolata TaxID=3074079 RepID=A0ABU2DSN7_9MICC|nr:F0F1 ATP synthase subunit B [Nesterenkonia sp. LY-0111]MDR8019517.1 F0F1 ATP synthase subunit B [Nesterenkonia sp. LY-0111]
MIRAEMLRAAGEDANPLVPAFWEIIAALLGFAVLFFVVVKFIAPAFEKAYQDRRQAIEGGLEEAEKAQAEAEAMKAEYEKNLAESRAEASRIREEARAEGAQIVAEHKEKAAAEAGRITEQAQQQIAAERQQAAASLRHDVGSLATQLAGRIVGEALEDDARSQRVVDRFLADLEAEQSGSAHANTSGAAH